VDIVAYTEAHAGQLLELAGRAGSIVAISSASVYRDDEGRSLDEASDAEESLPLLPVPIPESQATVPAGDGGYSTRKVAM
jgi:hypothetical protein